MTLPQFLSVAVLVGMMAMFLWGRFRYDVVAVMALLAAVVAGIVKPADAFRGFSDDIVIIVGSALVLSGAVQRSGAIERLMRRLQKHVTTVRSQLLLLAASVGLGSALVKNIGALAMMMPAAFQMAKKSDTSPSAFLMPMAFASLLGGLITLIGTSPNIIVSRVREEMTGQPFHMFDYAPVGLGLTVVGLIFLRFGYRLLPLDRRAAPTMGEALDIHDYATEAKIVEQSAAVGERVEDFIARHEQEVTISMFLRDGIRATPAPGTVLREGDILILGGAPDSLERAIARDKLDFVGTSEAPESEEGEEIGVIEAVVSAGSPLVGGTAGSLMLRQRFGINLIAVSRQGERIVRRMPNVIFRAGDVIVLQGPLGGLPQTLNELGALPLAERELRLGSVRKGLLPIAILAVAMAATATGVVPVTIAFFAAAAAVVITGALPVRDAYEHVEWPILIMLGALIPVSDTLRATGVTEIIGNWLSLTAASLPPWGAVALIMAAAMAVTPFLNNAATVLVMAPIAATFAGDLGLRPEAFLMATAVGAGCDFLTPIGHQCNTLVMGPGGYRFSDYARLGAPLSLLVLVVGTPLILWVWPVA
ncbi:SLC13 family permease [Sphingomonas koreensis]|jgi:di/tricarboxylate transporter|uniref:SLC13 family permease n=1 Tax=Sphingomonas koreensis TaxID=93064 RepID=A0A1L6JEL4_9SPHN|nr:SLC13 family permease [Sphingomonas koreensis]APR54328.1 SLC13 family permease [Sphingomonas koreensis]MDC7809350.1 SLC13 family permease [Sphingomonas koreensis]RSU18461.1 SLC13 family permease [Sphingomonas koreensis]RSU22488.1 SLC13 family permease [Sphingomonas koreensis]RSU23904.1 SLC13 family permease [Sphingomonas koreensis]